MLRTVSVLAALLASTAIAQVQLLGDVNNAPASGGVNTSPFANLGAQSYFSGTDTFLGRELFVTNGTPTGTSLFKDIRAGSNGSAVANLTTVGSRVFFSCSLPSIGTELCSTDGTVAGTGLLKDLRPGTNQSSAPSELVAANGRLFFSAVTATEGRELWTSDGTAGGTVLVKDIRPGTTGSSPTRVTAVGGRVYFFANDGTSGIELWVSDGTAVGTTRVIDLIAGSVGVTAGLTAALGAKLVFTVDDGVHGLELYSSDGTTGGTVLLKDINLAGSSNPTGLTVLGTTVYFAADDGTSGIELWKSDGTLAGTKQVVDLVAGTTGAFPGPIAAFGGQIYFVAQTPASMLYRTDGTSTGTTLVKDLGVSTVELMIAAGSQLFFTVETVANGRELWVSDGTAAGTQLTREVGPGARAGVASTLYATGSSVLFIGDDGLNGLEPWVSDGRANGTTMLKDLRPGTDDQGGRTFPIPALGGILAACVSPGAGIEMCFASFDAGVRVIDVFPGAGSSLPINFTQADGGAFFVVPQFELCKTDGTAAGTVLVHTDPSISFSPDQIAAFGDRVLFTAYDDDNGYELWVSDGTDAGTKLLKDIGPGLLESNPYGFVAAGPTMFFAADNGASGHELWKTDGTPAGTVLVKDINPGTAASLPTPLAVLGAQLLFAATDGTTGQELWASNGTDAGTLLLKDISPGATDSLTSFEHAVIGSTMLFSANDGTNGEELWKTDGTPAGTTLVKDIYPGSSSSLPTYLVAAGSLAYFSATDGVSGFELWKSDGTAAGTQRVSTLWDAGNAGVSYVTPYLSGSGQRVVFLAQDGVTGFELWSSDGTAAGTHQVADIVPGASGSMPFDLVNSNGVVYFTAIGPLTGRELYGFKPDFSPPSVTPVVTGTLNDAGWYTSDIWVMFTVTDAQSPASSCPGVTVTADTVGQTLSCTASSEGGSTQVSVVVKRDATSPILSCPQATLTIEATSPAGAVVPYSVSATDTLDPSPQVAVTPVSGSQLPIGTTHVNATARDTAGNQVACTFDVVVHDTVAPAVTCPAARTVEASAASGALVTYLPATATDAADATVALAYSKATDTLYPVGDTTVTVTATDDANNMSTCSFVVTVKDTVAPILICPSTQSFETTSADGLAVTFDEAQVIDFIDPAPVVSYSIANGSTFPIGKTAVRATAVDAAGNMRSCNFNVVVTKTTDTMTMTPKSGCGCGAGGGELALLGLALLGVGFRRRKLVPPLRTP